jgi:phenylacetate-CoA ligase
MPLIRYQLGDFVQMTTSNCSCGDLRPLLLPIGGRTANLITTNSRIVTPAFLNNSFSEFIRKNGQTILEYQVVQQDRDHLELFVVPGDQYYASSTFSELIELVQRILPEIQCKVTMCSSIPRLPSGKIQSFISHVTTN